MQAGAELDAEVARVVFGIPVLGIVPCHPWQDGAGWYPCHCLEDCRAFKRPEQRAVYPRSDADHGLMHQVVDPSRERLVLAHAWTCLEVVPAYSEAVAAAWQVVERMREQGWQWMAGWDEHGCMARFKRGESEGELVVSKTETIPAVICRAALAVLS